jgi:hypothetical protein
MALAREIDRHPTQKRGSMDRLNAQMITIRHAYADDELTLARLAVLDSAAAPPPRPVLLAEVDGELRAALSLSDGGTIADPFFPTVDLLELLRVHAAALRSGSRHGGARLRPRMRIGQLRTA